MKCNVIDIVLVELDINPVPSIANANFEFHAVASGSDERIVAVHDRKASAGLRQTGLPALLPRLRFPLSQTRLIRRHLSVCRLDGGSAKVARKFHEVVAEVVRRHQTLFRTNAQTFGNTNAIVGTTEIGEVSIPIRHHEFDEVIHGVAIHLNRVVKDAVEVAQTHGVSGRDLHRCMAMGWREYSVWYQASHNLTRLIDNFMSTSKSAASESQNDPVILRSFCYLIPVQEGI